MAMPQNPPQTVEDWLGRERGTLIALARSLVRSQADAEDCVQDASVAALLDPPKSNPGAWLRTVVRRRAHRQRRDAARRWRREVQAARPEGAPSADHAAEHIEIRRRVLAAVQALKEPYRTTVILRFFEGHRPSKIAALQGIPVKTVKTRLSRALELLRSELDRLYGGRRSAWAPLLASIGGVGRWGLALLLKKIAVATLLLGLVGGVAWWALGARSEVSVESASMEPWAPAEAPTLAGRGRAPAPAAPSVLREGDPVPLVTYAGRVVDPDGRGVAGARVDVLWQGTGPSSGETANAPHLILRREAERREHPSTITNDEGYFREDRPYESASYLRVDAKGFVPQIVGPLASGGFLLVRVAASGETRLRVLTEAGSPVVGADVRLTAPQLDPEEFWPEVHRQLLASVRSDASGRADLPSFTGTMGLEVVPAEADLETLKRSFVAAGELIEVRLHAATTVMERRIVDSETGAPISDAWVDVLPGIGPLAHDKGPQRRRIPADRNGRVRVPAQRLYDTIYAGAPGYELSEVYTTDSPDTGIALVRAMTLEGLVVDEDGSPVADAAIVIMSPDTGRGGAVAYEDAHWGRPPVAAWSDAAGRYTIEVALPSARPFARSRNEPPPDRGVRTLLALHPAHAAAAVDGLRVEPGRREGVTLRFPRPSSLAVEVVDEDGHPIAGQGVVVERVVPEAATWPAVARPRGVDTVALLRSRTLTTDGSGRVLADGLSPGRHLVLAENTRVEADVREGETVHVRVVKGAGPAIRGRVLDSKGVPRADVTLTLTESLDAYGYPSAQTTSRPGPDGKFAFDDLPAGNGYSVFVAREGVALGHFWLQTGSETTLRIPTGPARLSIRVDGPPVGTEQYSLLLQIGNMDFDRRPLPANPFETPPFMPGRGVVLVAAKGFGWVTVPFEAAEDRTTDVAVSLVPSGAAAVRVSGALLALESGSAGTVRLRRADGSPDPIAAIFPGMANSDVSATDAQSQEGEQDSVDGVFRFPDMPPGSYEASFGHYEHTSWASRASKRIEVRSGETIRVDL